MSTLGLAPRESPKPVCRSGARGKHASLCPLFPVLTLPIKVALPGVGMFKLHWGLQREREVHLSPDV